MVKHVVMWKLKDKNRAEELKDAIYSMKGKVSSMVDVECGINFNPGEAACDLVLISTHNSRTELDTYQDDPLHGEIKKIVGPAAMSRHVTDFEMD